MLFVLGYFSMVPRNSYTMSLPASTGPRRPPGIVYPAICIVVAARSISLRVAVASVTDNTHPRP